MKYIDIHCHLDFPDYRDDFQNVLTRMKEREVRAITIGTDLESSKSAVKIAEENENIWACIGIHPNEGTSPLQGDLPEMTSSQAGVETNSPDEVFKENEFEKLLQSSKVVAIGECGLDFFRISHFAEATRDKQKQLFIQQIEFALKYDKPLMLHCRNAYDEVLEILKNYPDVKGNCHFFAGNIEQAKQFLDLGFTMSFTGVITFTHDYDQVIKFLPADSIMSETDAPFVAPVPHRGKRNEPAFVIEVYKKMAEIKGEGGEKMRETIMHNAERLFNLT